MTNKNMISNVKLGIFVLTGSALLILMLYMIGRNKFMFGSNYILKARFENVQGLKPGNNIRFSGIDIGTVKNIHIIDDTTMEVTMIIGRKMKNIIRKNAIASIGTDGLVGNKVINIISNKTDAPLAKENDILNSRKPVDTDEMLRTLNRTGVDMAEIAAALKTTVNKINNSGTFWNLLNDASAGSSIKNTIAHLEQSSKEIQKTTENTTFITATIRQGKGSLGKLIMDTAIADVTGKSLLSIKTAGEAIEHFSIKADSSISSIKNFLLDENGNLYALNKDSLIIIRLKNSLTNIDRGSNGFNDIMDAMKHSFLFRGYFKKQQKQKANECQ